MPCQNTCTVIISKSNLVPLWDLEVYINNNTRIYAQFRMIISLFYRCLRKWLWRLGEMKYLSIWLEGGESSQYIAAVSLQRTRGLIVTELSEEAQAPGATQWQLCSDGSKPPFAPLATLLFHMLWSGHAMWDAQLAMWSGSGGRGPLPKASRRGTGFFFVVHGIESMLGNLLEPGLSKQRGEIV